MEEIRFEVDCNTSIPHFHQEMEILYVLSGRVAISGSDYNYVLEPEDFIVLNPYEHHEMYAGEGCHTISGYISPDILQQAQLGRISCCSRTSSENKEYSSLLRTKLAVLFKYHMQSSQTQKLYSLSQIFGLLAILKNQFETTENTSGSSHRDADRIQKVLTYIGKHYYKNLSLEEVAKHVYLSKSHLSREFQKQMGLSFSDYLRKLRLNRAANLLRYTDRTITDIALDCGFSNANTMILNFRSEYLETPGAYRRKYAAGPQKRKESDVRTQAAADPRMDLQSHAYMNLLKYASPEEITRPLDKKQQEPVFIQAGLLDNNGKLSLCHNGIVNIGLAANLLHASVHTILEKAVREIGFRFIRFRGALDDDIDVYHETSDGTPWLSFTYLDMILDEVLDLGLKPAFDFGFFPRKLVDSPRNIYRTSCVNIPDAEHLPKWIFLVEGTMKHFLERYGREEIAQWKYSFINAVYISYGVFTAEEYLLYYEKTFKCVRKFLPEAEFLGFGLDTGFLALNGTELLEKMLDYCQANHCLPDSFTFQCFSCDYSLAPLSQIERNLVSSPDQMPGEPVRSSSDPDVLRHEYRLCRAVLDQYHLNDRPIRILEWNSTIWQDDLGNDTCFKAAFIVKNILENCDGPGSISYADLIDTSDRRINNSIPFHGGYGLFTYNGIPKAGYYALQFLTFLQKRKGIMIAKGAGYCITRSEDGKSIQILLYNYCHYDEENHIDYVLSPQEQRSVDRYYAFRQEGTKSFHLHLKDLGEGIWQKRNFSITREQGSSYDFWVRTGAPDLKQWQELSYLSNVSTFLVQYESLHVSESGELCFSTVLDEHEVRLLLIDKK